MEGNGEPSKPLCDEFGELSDSQDGMDETVIIDDSGLDELAESQDGFDDTVVHNNATVDIASSSSDNNNATIVLSDSLDDATTDSQDAKVIENKAVVAAGQPTDDLQDLLDDDDDGVIEENGIKTDEDEGLLEDTDSNTLVAEDDGKAVEDVLDAIDNFCNDSRGEGELTPSPSLLKQKKEDRSTSSGQCLASSTPVREKLKTYLEQTKARKRKRSMLDASDDEPAKQPDAKRIELQATTTAPVAAAAHDDPDVTAESNTSEASAMMAGNFVPTEMMDESLLDEDDDYDDDEIIEMTLEEQERLLAEEEDEEEATLNLCDKTVEDSDADTTIKAPAAPKPPRGKIFSEIVAIYRNRLRDVYKVHNVTVDEDIEKELRRLCPKTFNHKKKVGVVVGYDTLEEFIDMNHPMWTHMRGLFYDYFWRGRDFQKLADTVHNQWNSQKVDVNKNLSCFASKKAVPVPKAEIKNIVLSYCKMKKKVRVDRYRGEVLEEMLAKAKEAKGIMEREEARREKYQRLLESQQNPQPDERSPAPVGNARPTFDSMQTSPQNLLLNPQINLILDLLDTREIARAVDLVKSVEEANALRDCYSTDKTTPKATMADLLSMEEVIQMEFPKYYASPYNKGRAAGDKVR